MSRPGSDASGLDRLFTAPPREFTLARNRLAAELRKAGRGAEAAEVGRARKPTPAVWAINQLARRDRDAIERLLHALETLEASQLGGSAEAPRGRDAALAPLVEKARAILAEAGLPTSRETVERVSATLWAAAVDRRSRPALLGGRLREELALPGFEVFAGRAPARIPAARLRGRVAERVADRGESERRRRAREREARAGLKAAKTEAARLEREASALERKAETARRVADEATRLAGRARQDADRAAAKQKELEETALDG